MFRRDVVVVGGGFAGSACALLLKREHPALRILLVERRQEFDRKVGESAIELSSWFMTRVLGLDRHLFLDQLPKYGLRFWFFNDAVKGLEQAGELGNRYQTRVPSFHIDRAKLDEHVQGLAVAEGVELLRPARVSDARFPEGEDPVLRIESGGGAQEVSARWVVDATGRAAWLARAKGLLQPVPEHPTWSVWARYSGTRDFDRGWLPSRDGRPGESVASRGFSTNHFTGPGWWVWIIPLPGGDVSVGVVWDERIFDLPAGENLPERFETFMRSFPAGRELMREAVRREGDLHALRHLPYRVRRVMGDGWAMVGDAAGFIDPFYSPGLDWASCTVSRVADLVGKDLAGALSPAARQGAIERHNAEFTRSFERWLRALYVDKYHYLGDSELMEIALRLEVALYYFGVVTPAYRDPHGRVLPPFAAAVSTPFYLLMRWVNARLAGLGKVRLAAGTWGRANAGRRVLLKGFKLGPGSLRLVPYPLARLAWLEAASIPDRLAARRRRRARRVGLARATAVPSFTAAGEAPARAPAIVTAARHEPTTPIAATGHDAPEAVAATPIKESR